MRSVRLVKFDPNETAGSIGLAYSPDGRRLVACTQTRSADRNIRSSDLRDLPQPRIHLIDSISGRILETMIAPPGVCFEPTFSPDGKILATGGLGRIMLWDMQ
jgi:WD40 repeat protein